LTRPQAFKAGLRGSIREPFPAEARDSGRELGLRRTGGEISILDRVSTEDDGGATSYSYAERVPPERGRIDPLGSRSTEYRGDQVSEASTHIVTFDEGVSITVKDRVFAEGKTWAVTALRDRSDRLVTRIEVTSL